MIAVCVVRAEKHRWVAGSVDGRMVGNTTRAVRRRIVDGVMISFFRLMFNGKAISRLERGYVLCEVNVLGLEAGSQF